MNEKIEKAQETVTRLLDARDEEGDEETTPEGPEFAEPGEHELSEAESLILENLELKQEIYRQRLQALEFKMTGLVERVRSRLVVAEGMELRFTPNMQSVHVVDK